MLWRILKPVLSGPFKQKYNLHAYNLDKVPTPPFLLIGNHSHFIDAALIEAFLEYPVVWAVAAGNFKSVLLGPILKAGGAIEKRKGVADLLAMRKMLRVIKEGGIVGLMPEGSVSWNGEFGEVPDGTEKFLERIDVPIVAVKVEGGYLTKPRWADHSRKGRIDITFELFSGSEALDFLSLASDWRWQEKNKVLFKGRNRAEGIERILWFCPRCESFRTVTAKGNDAICANCRETITLDELGYVQGRTVTDTVQVQKNLLARYLSKEGSLSLGSGRANELELSDGKSFKFDGPVSLNDRHITVGPKGYDLERVRGFSTFVKRVNEFNYDQKVVRLKTEHSSYLLYCAYKILANQPS